jgi:hypothetical protein
MSRIIVTAMIVTITTSTVMADGIAKPGDLLVGQYYANQVLLFDGEGNPQGTPPFASEGLSHRSGGVAFTPDGQYLLVGSSQEGRTLSSVQKYDPVTGDRLGYAIPPGLSVLSSTVNTRSFLANGDLVVSISDSGSFDGGLIAYDIAAGSYERIAENTIYTSWGLAVSPITDNVFVSSYYDNVVYEYANQGGSWSRINTIGSGILSHPHGLTFSPEGKMYVTSNGTSSTVEFDLDNNTTRSFSGNISYPITPEIGPDGNLYVAGHDSNNVVKYDIDTGASEVLISGVSSPLGLAFKPGITPDPPKTHVLSVGVRDRGGWKEGKWQVTHDGRWNAAGVMQGFKNMENLNLGEVEDRFLYTSDLDSAQELAREINTMKAKVNAGDVFVFYINCHGNFRWTGKEDQVDVQSDSENELYRAPSTGNEYLVLSTEKYADHSEMHMSDDEFSALFRDDPAWDGVKKLFIIDTCFAGGFYGSDNGSDTGDLSTVNNVAVIAASRESDQALSVGTGDRSDPDIGYAEGVLGKAVIAALAELSDWDTVTFDDLFTHIDDAQKEWYGHNGYFQERTPGSPEIAIPLLELERYATVGFDWNTEMPPVPEPTTLSLLALGGLAVLRRHRRQ